MKDSSIKTSQQLGAFLRGYRRDHGLTQQDVGAMAGVAQKVISQLETEPGPTSFARVLKVLAVLDLDLVVRPRAKAAPKSEW